MKKLTATLIFLLGILSPIFSSIVDVNTAHAVADRFMVSHSTLKSAKLNQGTNSSSLSLSQIFYEQNDSLLKSAETVPTLYVFTAQDNNFVVVSAEDNTAPVLAFSDENSYSSDFNPAAMAMLESYSKQIAFIRKHKLESAEDVKAQWHNELSGDTINSDNVLMVLPLLSTKWNQGCFYNEMCPEDPHGACGHAPVGCIAVAMGQIMNYWKYPHKGDLILGYNSRLYGEIPKISPTIHNWNEMEDSLSQSNNAVASLLFHSGVAARMSYSTNFSGTTLDKAQKALNTYFMYNDDSRIKFRQSFTNEEWREILSNELINKRPILYNAFTANQEGHAFVCDGFTRDYFHMNWGWGGNCDGYYKVASLIPVEKVLTDDGLIEVPKEYNFALGQKALINLFPSVGDIEVTNAKLYSPYEVEAGGKVEVGVDQYYYGVWDSIPEVCFKYYLSIDSFISFSDVYLGEQTSLMNANNAFVHSIQTFKLPDKLASGNYYILCWADATAMVSENFESNNVVSVPIYLNNAPVSIAGENQVVGIAEDVVLNAAASYDPNGDKLSYIWLVPENISLNVTDSVKPNFISPYVYSDTVITIQLIVSDGKTFSEPSTVNVTIKNNIPYRIYPNPVSNGKPILVRVRSKQHNFEDAFLLITSTSGRVIQKKQLKPQMAITDLLPGIYIFHLQIAGDFYSQKVVVGQ